jgi:hypothetical protein
MVMSKLGEDTTVAVVYSTGSKRLSSLLVVPNFSWMWLDEKGTSRSRIQSKDFVHDYITFIKHRDLATDISTDSLIPNGYRIFIEIYPCCYLIILTF